MLDEFENIFEENKLGKQRIDQINLISANDVSFDTEENIERE